MVAPTESIASLSDRQRNRRRQIVLLLGLMLAGGALRLAVQMGRGDELRTDPDAYVALASGILQHGGFQLPASDLPTAFRPPVYPLLLSAPLAGRLPEAQAVLIVNLLMGTLLVPAAWWLATVAGLTGGWALWPAMLCALDPLLLRYSSLPMTEVTAATLLTVALAVQLTAIQRFQKFRSSAIGWRVSAGVLFGLSGLTRPVTFLTCAAVCVAELLFVRPPTGQPSRGRLFRPLLIAAGAALVLLPWVWRNAVVFQTFVPATTHGGYTLLLGNNDVFYREVVQADGQPVWGIDSLTAWQRSLQQRMREQGVSINDETAVDRWMYDQARRSIGRHRPEFLRACLLRWKRFWAVTPTLPGGSVVVRTMVGVWYMTLFALLLCSLRPSLVGRPDVLILWAAVISFLVLHTFYWTNTRMRAPLAAVIAVLAMIAWQHLTGKLADPKAIDDESPDTSFEVK